ncbi:beta-2-microglobulin [Gasterosteus aculeatus]|uniref:Beta-2-microglobulin n=1 Tax=Gasterosteus aculeatus aculeatus TaxID=481459 RepID=G3Q6I7_GASAC|nr:beta-2-microglobulin-like [Gasterosteus aculeatus aculeatus]
MKILVCAFVVGLLSLASSQDKTSSPKVEVYSKLPGEYGKVNTLICHVTDFHPPEIKIELLRNRQAIPGAMQTDLAFEASWHYHLTKHVPFTPQPGDTFSCNVTHVGISKIYTWEPDM